MTRYVIKRVVAGLFSIFVLTTITFFLMHAVPGGPFSPAEQRDVPPEVLQQIEAKYGLDKPVYEQYLLYMGGLLHGDFGNSFKKADTSVNELIGSGFPVSAEVGGLAILLAMLVGIPLGIASAIHRGKFIDKFSMTFATVGISVPSFVLSVLLMFLFAVKLRILPTYGLETWQSFILPVFCLAFSPIAYITRLMRSSMLEVMRQDFIRTARSKGVSEFFVIAKHALRNSIIPIVTYLGPLVAALLTGSFVIERLFSIPGIGRYFVSGISDRDYSVTLGLTIFFGALLILCNIIVDLFYVIIDPRVKIED
jgi:oligopeptide transport system permease protein